MKTLRDAVFHFDFEWPGKDEGSLLYAKPDGNFIMMDLSVCPSVNYRFLGTRKDFEAEARKIINKPPWEKAPSDAEYAAGDGCWIWYKNIVPGCYQYQVSKEWAISTGKPLCSPLIPRPKPHQCCHFWEDNFCKRCNSKGTNVPIENHEQLETIDEEAPKVEQQCICGDALHYRCPIHGQDSTEQQWRGPDPERIAQLIAHRVCCGTEHDPEQGKLHGYCIVCGVPWPCVYAGRPPAIQQSDRERVIAEIAECLESGTPLNADNCRMCAERLAQKGFGKLPEGERGRL